MIGVLGFVQSTADCEPAASTLFKSSDAHSRSLQCLRWIRESSKAWERPAFFCDEVCQNMKLSKRFSCVSFLPSYSIRICFSLFLNSLRIYFWGRRCDCIRHQKVLNDRGMRPGLSIERTHIWDIERMQCVHLAGTGIAFCRSYRYRKVIEWAQLG